MKNNKIKILVIIIVILLLISLLDSCVSTQVSKSQNFFNKEIKKEYIQAEKRIRKQQKSNKKNREIINKRLDRKQSKHSPTYMYY